MAATSPSDTETQMDSLSIESELQSETSHYRNICTKTVLTIVVVILIIINIALISIISVLMTKLSNQQDNMINQSYNTTNITLPYPIACCNTYTNKQLCNLYNISCIWSTTTQTCNYISNPSLFEKDLCFQEQNESCTVELDDDYASAIPTFEIRDELLQHSTDEFPSPPQPEIIQVTNDVYVGIGYDLANTIFIETQTGIIIIDTLSAKTAARNVFNDYKALRIDNNARNESQMIIEAIILTHFHTDHVYGIGFWESLNGFGGIKPKIYAHETLLNGFKDFMIYGRTVYNIRAQRQFGTVIRNFIDDSLDAARNLFINAGIGPHLDRHDDFSFVNPINNEQFVLISDEEYILNVSNKQLLLMHSPGETPDQLTVWYEEKKVLLVGDNIYHAFPNLYAIRGTPARDPKKWMNSLDKLSIKYSDAEYLVGSHTLPVTENIQTELIIYRDLIAYVHDQTIRHMANRLDIDNIIRNIENDRPEILRHGSKQELYGTMEWSIRSIYDLYIGWFQGDSSQLYPSTIYQRGKGLYLLLKTFYELDSNSNKNMIDVLVEYCNDILDEAEHINDDINYVQVALREERWILELITSLSSVYGDFKKCDEWRELMELRWKIMEKIAGRSVSANGRNYLISQFLQERFPNSIDEGLPSMSAMVNVYINTPIEWVLEMLRFRVNPISIQNDMMSSEWKTNIKFTDSGLMFHLWLRNGGVLFIEEYSKYNQSVIDKYDENASIIYEMKEDNYKFQQLDMTYVIKGSELDLEQFWSKFDPSLLSS
eukprot:409969_1